MTPHFTFDELRCKCGCRMLPKQDFMDKVEALRVALGFPLEVSSAARCPKHNAKVSSTGSTGPHTTGRAIDLAVRGAQALRVVQAALAAGFSGIGVQQKGASRFIHIDDLPNTPSCPRPTIWSY
jgi:zinc D-Ala-D-Ala carboxypeptidase